MFTMWLRALATVLLGALGAWAAEPTVTFVESKYQNRLKPEEIEWIKQEVIKAYPKAIDRIVAYFGDEKWRDRLSSIQVAIYDNFADEGLHGRSAAWYYKARDDQQAITLFGQRFITGQARVEDTLTHELIHVVQEMGQGGYKAMKGTPKYIIEGMAYHESPVGRSHVISWLNRAHPELEFDKFTKSKRMKNSLAERLFVTCIEDVYGKPAADDFISRFSKGQHYQSALKKATGEKEWTVARAKARKCRDNRVKDLLAKAEPFREVKKAHDADMWGRVVELADKLHAETPDHPWMGSVQWKKAFALEDLGRVDEAMDVFEGFRIARFGMTNLDSDAAYQIVRLLNNTNRCDEAKSKRTEFERFYPSFYRQSWRKELDDDAEHCDDIKPIQFEASRAKAEGDHAAALAAYERGLAMVMEKDGDDVTRNAWYREQIGKSHRARKDFAAAEAVDRETAERLRNAGPEKRRRLTEILGNLIEDLEGQSKRSEAEAVVGEILAVYKDILGPYDAALPEALVTQARLAHRQGRDDEAAAMFDAALAQMRECVKKDDTRLAKALYEHAAFLKDTGGEGAADKAKEAASIFHQRYPNDAEWTQKADGLVVELGAS